jgi:hypothetical protein
MTSIALEQTRLRLSKINYAHLIVKDMLALCAFWETFVLVSQARADAGGYDGNCR